jgi:Fe2+ transport system protein FeoA
MKLSEIKTDNHPQLVQVTDFAGPDLMVERLLEIGFHKGCQLQVLGRAPLKGPLLVELNTTVFALRDEESECLLIQLR